MKKYKEDSMMGLKQFFSKSLGLWESHRSYLYVTQNNKIEESITKFEWVVGDQPNEYRVFWNNSIVTRDRSMGITIVDDYTLQRDQGYFTPKPTVSQVVRSSEDILITVTEYNGMNFNERIEFVTKDYRLRRTIARYINSDGTLGDINLIGNYLEKRLCQEGVEDNHEKEMLENLTNT